MQWVPFLAAFFLSCAALTLVDFLLVFNLFKLKALLTEGFDLFLRCAITGSVSSRRAITLGISMPSLTGTN
jgi:hypothetical protein